MVVGRWNIQAMEINPNPIEKLFFLLPEENREQARKDYDEKLKNRLQNSYCEYNKDGTYHLSIQDTNDETGTWRLDNDHKTIILMPEGATEERNETIMTLQKDSLVTQQVAVGGQGEMVITLKFSR